MENTKRLLAMVLSLVFMFTVMMSGAVFADNGSDKSGGKNEKATEEKVKGNDKVKTEETVTTVTEEEKDNAAMKALLEEKKNAKKTLNDPKASTEEKVAAYANYIKCKEQLKVMVRDQYTTEELAQLDQTAAAIVAADPTVEVLPVEKVIAKGLSMKLDIPPIYKEGKVHVPVRAFVSAYGANVKYDETTKQITITTVEGKVLTINVETGVVTVSGNTGDVTSGDTQVQIVRPTNVNGRIVLPVGFLAEQLGLKAEVDEEGTVEIEDEDEAEDVVSPLPNTTITQ